MSDPHDVCAECGHFRFAHEIVPDAHGPFVSELPGATIARLERENAELRTRVSDLKLALGDNAGWFDRAMAAENARDAIRTERDEARKLAVELGKCQACHGQGTRWPPCPYCHDSTHDHECPPKQLCTSCSGTGHDARVAAWVT